MIVENFQQNCPREEHGLWAEDIKVTEALIKADDETSIYEPSLNSQI